MHSLKIWRFTCLQSCCRVVIRDSMWWTRPECSHQKPRSPPSQPSFCPPVGCHSLRRTQFLVCVIFIFRAAPLRLSLHCGAGGAVSLLDITRRSAGDEIQAMLGPYRVTSLPGASLFSPEAGGPLNGRASILAGKSIHGDASK